MDKNNKKKEAGKRWDIQPWIRGMGRIWTILFSAIKIAAGALATVLLICLVCGFVFAGILSSYLEDDILPSAYLDLDSFALDKTSFLYYVDGDGKIQKLQQIYASEDRQWAEYEDIPEALIQATVAIEDKRFFEHQGVDWFTTIKACASMFFGDGKAGGSSLTQQFIKNYTQEDSVTVQRKVLEIIRAVQFEKRYDKEVVLEWYLNTIYLGNGCGGVRSAAAHYFGKEVEKLTIAECASLISITNNPTIFDPYRAAFSEGGKTGRERNRERQLIVLGEMYTQGWITREEYDEAVNQELVFRSGIKPEDRISTCSNESCGYKDTLGTFDQRDGEYHCPRCGRVVSASLDASQDVYSWFTEVVLEDVAKAFAEKNGIQWNEDSEKIIMEQIRRGGFHIYTTLDADVQAQVDKIYTNLDEIPDTLSGQQLQSGIVVIDNRTGDIVALSGGVGEKKDFDAWNRATDAEVQSGSSIKPLSIYAPGFEVGAISPATVIKDLPLQYDVDEETGAVSSPWPRNDNRRYSYSRTIFSAVVDSVNAVAANTLDGIGLSYSYNFAKSKFGLSSLVDKYVHSNGYVQTDQDYAPLAMGAQTFGVHVRDMSNAFATFANNGIYRTARTFTKVYDSDGNVVLDNKQESKELLSEKTVNYMNYCLTNAVDYGTGGGAIINGTAVAGKTGTTSSNKDRWFCGFTAYYTAAVWCGYDIPEVINMANGSYNPAARLWRKVMEPLHKGKAYVELYDSTKMVEVEICLDSGKIATDACRLDVRTLSGYSSSGFTRVDKVLVYEEDLPTELCNKHVLVDYCKTGHGTCSEYCHKFAQVDTSVSISLNGLVKLSPSEIQDILNAERYYLWDEFLLDNYIYLLNENGTDGSFKGLHNDANANVEAPYLVCPVHTQQAWEAYLAAHPPVQPSEPIQPDTPVVPGVPDNGTVAG